MPLVTYPAPAGKFIAEEEEQLTALQGRTDIGDVERTALVKNACAGKASSETMSE